MNNDSAEIHNVEIYNVYMYKPIMYNAEMYNVDMCNSLMYSVEMYHIEMYKPEIHNAEMYNLEMYNLLNVQCWNAHRLITHIAESVMYRVCTLRGIRILDVVCVFYVGLFLRVPIHNHVAEIVCFRKVNCS